MKKRMLSVLMILLLVFGCVDVDAFAVASSVPTITYRAHVEELDWMSTVKNGKTAGTTGKGYRLEALKINLKKNGTSMIQYQAHVQDVGWQKWVKSGCTVGTTGKSRRMEAIRIKLTGSYANSYNVYYRVHVAEFGWLGWAKNGQTAGSTGIGAQIEAIQIKLLKKGSNLSTSVPASISPSLTYKSHVANIGWMSSVSQNQVSGTTGQSKQLEAFSISLKDPFGKSNIKYRSHVSDIGWQSWKTSGNVSGTTGQSKPVEAIQISLTDSYAAYYDVYYRVHVSNLGWLGWTKNGAYAGTTGGRLPVEAFQVKLVKKGTSVNVGGAAYYDKTQQGQKIGMTTIESLQKKFPAGAYWNHAGSKGNNPNGYTYTPCSHHGNCSKGGRDYSGACGCNSFGGAIQCFGFANKLAYDAFGSLYTSWSRTTLSAVKPGDVIRYKNNGHSIFVTAVSGNMLTYADCNSDNRCKIRWGVVISKSQVAKTLTAVYSSPR